MDFFNSKSAELLFITAKKMGLNPEKLTEYGLIAITVNNATYHIFQSYTLLNSHLSSKLSQHKHLTRVVLEASGLPNIPYARAGTREEVINFLEHHKIIVAKPVQGSRSQDIRILDKKEDIKFDIINDFIFEKYIEGREFRYLVLNNKVISVQERIKKNLINDPKNVKRISFEKEDWNSNLVRVALSSAKSLHLHFAAVDFISDDQGNQYILEVNSAPGLWYFQHPHSGPGIDIAKMLLEATINRIKKIV